MRLIIYIFLLGSTFACSFHAMQKERKVARGAKDENPLSIILEQLASVTKEDLKVRVPSEHPDELRRQFIELATRHREIVELVRMTQHSIRVMQKGHGAYKGTSEPPPKDPN